MKQTLLGVVLGLVVSAVLFIGWQWIQKENSFDLNTLPAYSTTYRKTANPHLDLTKALQRAKAEQKKVLLMVGGDWCRWSGVLDHFLETNNDIAKALYSNFEVVRVYYGKEISKEGKSLLKQFPAVKETPHFFILDYNAKLLASIETTPLEKGYSYSRDKFKTMIEKYK